MDHWSVSSVWIIRLSSVLAPQMLRCSSHWALRVGMLSLYYPSWNIRAMRPTAREIDIQTG